MFSSFLVPLILLPPCTDAVNIPFQTVQRPRYRKNSRLGNILAQCGSSNCGRLGNIMDEIYVSDISVGGKSFNVLLDTGSADLWVNGSLQPIPSARIMQNVIVSEVYGDESNYTGPVAFATVEFHGITVANQSFTNAIIAENDNTAELNVTGLIGLSFDSLSKVTRAVEATTGSEVAGRTFLSNVFAVNPAQPRFITFLLSRVADTNATAQDGAFTISEIVNGYEAIERETPVPLFPPDNEEWTTRIDQILINGRATSLPRSVVSNSADVPLVGLLDTGTSNIIAADSIVRQVYQGISGAVEVEVDPQTSLWAVPCDANPPSLGFSIAGKTYNVNPLDLNPIQATYRHSGKLVSFCLSGLLAATPQRNRFDILLGSPFLRSVYAMFDFGDNSTNVRSPFTKLLSTYDPQAQSSSFANTRRAQLAQAPAASRADIRSILDKDPSYVLVDNPSVTSSNGGSGQASNVFGLKAFHIETITILAAGLIALSYI